MLGMFTFNWVVLYTFGLGWVVLVFIGLVWIDVGFSVTLILVGLNWNGLSGGGWGFVYLD